MRLKQDVKPITYMKNHAADLVRSVSESNRTVLITQNGEAKVVVMDVETYDRWQSALALLKILEHSEADVEAGRVVPQDEVFARAKRSLKSKARKSSSK
jgi:prevent-host-death family protein